MTRLFVTGGTGFVGSHFVAQALARGCEVVALRHNLTSEPRITLVHAPAWLDKPMTAVTKADLAGCDAVVHLAAHGVNPPSDTLEECFRWNFQAPLHLLRVAHEAGATRIVVAGSCFEYGRSGEQFAFIPSDAPLRPTSAYAASKAAATLAFSVLAAELGLRLSIHRIFQVYGEGEGPTRLWPALRRAALAGDDFPMTTGEQIRDFIPVEQVAARLLHECFDDTVEAGQVKIENVGTGNPQTVRAFAEHWWQHWNATGKLLLGAIPTRPGEVTRYVAQVKPLATN
jgi:nucleoside-diphosphate-sugar epimerase